MSYYRVKKIIDGEEWILYGWEDNIAIWQLAKATQAKKRQYYAHVDDDHRFKTHTVREIRELIVSAVN